MAHPYLVNMINAGILILAGLVGYFSQAASPAAALIAPAVGILLLACTHHLRRHNRFVLNTVTAVTLLMGITTILRISPADFTLNTQHILLLLIGLSCFTAVAFYIATFIRERRMRNNTIYKDDL